MNPSTAIKDKILEEINLLPENTLLEVYNFIHYFRLGAEKSTQQKANDVMSFAGAWKDVPDDTFDGFLSDIADRRNKAFGTRRSDETVAD